MCECVRRGWWEAGEGEEHVVNQDCSKFHKMFGDGSRHFWEGSYISKLHVKDFHVKLLLSSHTTFHSNKKHHKLLYISQMSWMLEHTYGTCWSLLNLWTSSIKRMVFLLNMIFSFLATFTISLTSFTPAVVAESCTNFVLSFWWATLAMIRASVVCCLKKISRVLANEGKQGGPPLFFCSIFFWCCQ